MKGGTQRARGAAGPPPPGAPATVRAGPRARAGPGPARGEGPPPRGPGRAEGLREACNRAQRVLPAGCAAVRGAAGAAAGAALAALAGPAAAVAETLQEFENERAFQDFNVDFLGLSFDHKMLIYLIVLGQFIGFVGASVGGYTAKQRKEEVEELNKRLLKVTRKLRMQARSTQTGAYTPLHIPIEKEGKGGVQLERRTEIINDLKVGKDLLREDKAEEALAAFERALVEITHAGNALDSPWKAKRKACRGLGSAHQRLGNHAEALGYMKDVISITVSHNDTAGLGDAYGVAADICTEMGDYVKAAEYYDLYIADMSDGAKI